jgi:hypothetical protein
MRRSLCAEAIRLSRVLAALMPDEPEALGLLALMLLHDARREGRVDESGDLVPLEQQDRSRWDRADDRRRTAHSRRGDTAHASGPLPSTGGDRRVPRQRPSARPRPTGSRSPGSTQSWSAWCRPPVVGLNRAVAVAMADGPEAGLAWSTRSPPRARSPATTCCRRREPTLLRRLGRSTKRRGVPRSARAAATDAESRYLARRLAEVSVGPRILAHDRIRAARAGRSSTSCNPVNWSPTAGSRARRASHERRAAVGNILGELCDDDRPWWRVVQANGQIVSPRAPNSGPAVGRRRGARR